MILTNLFINVHTQKKIIMHFNSKIIHCQHIFHIESFKIYALNTTNNYSFPSTSEKFYILRNELKAIE